MGPTARANVVASTALRSRQKILVSFERCIEALTGKVGEKSLRRAQSTAEQLGILSGELDRKLRHASELRRLVIDLLQQLVQDLSELAKQGALHSIILTEDHERELEHTLRSLTTLVSTIEDAAPSDNVERLSQAVLKDPFTQFNIRHVAVKFPHSDRKLQRRVGALNQLRRLRLQDAQYAFERRVQSAIQQNLGVQQAENVGNIGLPDEAQHLLIVDDTQFSFLDNLNALAPEDASDTSSIASSDSSLTSNFDYDFLKGPNLFRHLELAHDEVLRIPPMPSKLDKTAAQEARCPFCRLSLRRGMNEQEWEAHVLDDLEPFMCTFGGCSQNYRTYGSREDWERHENSKHRFVQVWRCHACNESWDDVKAFENHMRSRHSAEFMESQLEAITRMCETLTADDKPRECCIFCGTAFSTIPEEYDHLASHLLEVALFVLPKLECYEYDVEPANDEDETYSETYEPPAPIKELSWFQDFEKDLIVPFESQGSLFTDASGHTQSAVCIAGSTAGTVYLLKTYRKFRNFYGPYNEALLLETLHHAHVVPIVGTYNIGRHFTMVFSPGVYLRLFDIFRKDTHAPVLTKWFGCLVSALSYLHARDIDHGDIKPSNVWIKNNSIVLSGFYNARDDPFVYTPQYAPPEKGFPGHLGRGFSRLSSDIFSLGCVFLEMLTVISGKELKDLESFISPESTHASYAQSLEKSTIWLNELVREAQAPLGLVFELCSSMMQDDPDARPTASHILDTLTNEHLKMASSPSPRTDLVGRCTTGKLNKEQPDDTDMAEPV